MCSCNSVMMLASLKRLAPTLRHSISRYAAKPPAESKDDGVQRGKIKRVKHFVDYILYSINGFVFQAGERYTESPTHPKSKDSQGGAYDTATGPLGALATV